MDIIRINEEYTIKKMGSGFALIWTSLIEKEGFSRKENKKTKHFPTWTKYYGTLSQSMVGFVHAYMESFKGETTLKELEERADHAYGITHGILDKLSDVDKAVAEEWKIVRYTNG